MVGGLAVVASIVRLYALWLYNITKDISYDSIFVSDCDLPPASRSSLITPQILLLSQIEVNVAIISASVPTIRPLFRNTFLSFSQPDTYGSTYFGHGTIGSGRIDTHNSRNGIRSSRQFELLYFSGRNPLTRQDEGRSNTSEESILKGVGITKTTETTVDFEEIDTVIRTHT